MNEKGNIVLDLKPEENNPRNSEGAFINHNDGSISYIYSRYHGESARDEAGADLAIIHSKDDGLTWTKPEILFTNQEHSATNIMSVSLLRLANGDIGLFYLIRKGWHDTRLHMRRSSDDGATWSDYSCCVAWPGYHVTNNDRVIKLSNGRLIFPTGYHHITRNIDDPDCKTNESSQACFFYSDDDGISWVESPQSVAYSSPHNPSGLQEPGLIELSDGRIWAWARTDLGRQYEWFSLDSGLSWSHTGPSRFTGPCSPLSMKRCPDGRLIAVWNPIPDYITRPANKWGWGRTPLVYSLSSDDGKTWSEPVILEDDEKSGYCYIAIHFTKTALLLGYCAGGNGITCLSQTRIRRIELDSLIK